jgi:hypothetical protein
MPRTERRRRRGATTTEALRYQLEACCRDGRLEAMVLSDEDGLLLAASGGACDEVAAKMAHIGARIHSFDGSLLQGGQKWDVKMIKVPIEGTELLVCAVGGSPEQRKRQITRGAEGAARILAV